MRLIDLAQRTNWAIIPEKLDAIHQVLFRHMHGMKIDHSALEIQLGRKLENGYDVTVTEEGLAIIPIHGVLAKRMNLFMEISGGASTEILMRDIDLALKDDDVKAILLDIDSPGGTVDGTEALADFIYESRGEKPIIAFANGFMASAAYWIGSAADMIITEETGEVGSIGVVMAHYDYSKYNEKMGVKRTFIYAGKYKTMGNNAEPLSREAEDYLQEGVDYMYSIFVDTIARNRGVSVETVLENMADGRIFIGRQALEAGLIDSIGGFNQAALTALSNVKEERDIIYQIKKRGAAPEKKEEELKMVLIKKKVSDEDALITIDLLNAEYPDIVEQLRQEGAESVDTEKIGQEATQAERERILGLANMQFGEEAGSQFKAIVETGVTVDQFKAVRGSQSADNDKGIKKEILDAIKNAGSQNPGAGDATNPGDGQDFMSQVQAYQSQNKCSKGKAIQAVQKMDPKGHEAWIKSMQTGAQTVH